MGLEGLVGWVGEVGVFGGAGPVDAEVGDAAEDDVGLRRGGDGEEVGAVDVFEPEGGAGVGGGGGELYVGELEVLEVAKEEALGGGGAEAAGVGVAVFVLGGLDGLPVGEGFGVRAGAEGGGETGGGEVAVVDLDVFDEVAGDAGEDGRGDGGGVVADDVRDEDAAERCLGAWCLWGRGCGG